MDACKAHSRIAAHLRHAFPVCLSALLALAPSGARADAATVDKLSEQARRQASDSRTKVRPAERRARTAAPVDRELVKLMRRADEEAARATGKSEPSPARSLFAQQLLTKLHERAINEALTARRKAGSLPLPARRAAAVLQDGTQQIVYGDTLTGSVLVASEQVQYSFTGTAGDVVDITISSNDFDTYLELYFDGYSEIL